MTETHAAERYGPQGAAPSRDMLDRVLSLIKFTSTFEFMDRDRMEAFAQDHADAPFSSRVLQYPGLLNSNSPHSPGRSGDWRRRQATINANQELHRSDIRDEVASTLPVTSVGYMMWSNAVATWTTDNVNPNIPNSKYKSTGGGMARFAPINQYRPPPHNKTSVKLQTLVADPGKNVIFFQTSAAIAGIASKDKVTDYTLGPNNIITINVIRGQFSRRTVTASLIPVIGYYVCDFILENGNIVTSLHSGHAVITTD